jgi:glycosyltransferase involved in cell wall biosynthesis
MTPEVSVIIPVFNAAKTLGEAVESVRAQQFEPMEIIIVDDGSTDDTPRVVDGLGPGIRRFSQPNKGPSAARNLGISQSRGGILAMLDADDLWPKGKLALQLGRLREDPDLQVVSGRTQLVSMDETPLGTHRFEGDDRRFSGVNLGAALFRREAFDLVGLFDESLRFSEDQDWFLRARELHLNMVVLKQITLIYRRHENNMTRQKTGADLLWAPVLKKSLDRRRQQSPATGLRHWSSYDDQEVG